jgi:hypothetical protein
VSKNIQNNFTPFRHIAPLKGSGQAIHRNVKQGVCHTMALPIEILK